MDKQSIIIIGAGATGLMAAKELSADFNVTILEAAARTGGRVHSITHNGNIIEAGAEFVHGNLPLTLGLLKTAGIEYVEVAGNMYRKKDGQLKEVTEMTAGWDDLLKKMGDLQEDITVQELLDKHFAGPGNELLRRQAKSYAEGFDVADINRASAKALYKEWSAEDEENYRIPAGYGTLLNYLQHQAETAGAILHTGTPIKKVTWRTGAVTVFGANGKEFTAGKLLITVPVSLLQQPAAAAHIQFSPELPFDEKVAGDIGFGAVIKVVLKFKNVFWKADTGFVLSDEAIPTWWTQSPDQAPLLTGWLGGPKAALVSGEPDEVILEKAFASLSAIFDQPVAVLQDEVEDAMVFNWQKNEYAMGAYSYATVQSEKAKKIITTPIANTLYFAGEALYSGDHPGTVEAALVSGIDTASIIKKTIL